MINLFKRNYCNTFDIIIWWEIRRILYITVVFVVGLLSFFIGFVNIPLIYFLFAINLNLLYTLSWIIEITLIAPKDSKRITYIYIKTFNIVFYAYSIISILLYVYIPELLDWTLIPYGL